MLLYSADAFGNKTYDIARTADPDVSGSAQVVVGGGEQAADGENLFRR